MLRYAACVVLAVQWFCGAACADIMEPINALIPLSVKPYFIMGAQIPRQEWFAYDQTSYLAVTAISAPDDSITLNDETLMARPGIACSVYDQTVCSNVHGFYRSSYPNFIVSGFLAMDADSIVSFGLNSGYSAPKLTISPQIMVGFAKRIYVGDVTLRDSHLIVEANTWIGGTIEHRPCYDAYERAYYCGNLSAWSDFSYLSTQQSFNAFIWYEHRF